MEAKVQSERSLRGQQFGMYIEVKKIFVLGGDAQNSFLVLFFPAKLCKNGWNLEKSISWGSFRMKKGGKGKKKQGTLTNFPNIYSSSKKPTDLNYVTSSLSVSREDCIEPEWDCQIVSTSLYPALSIHIKILTSHMYVLWLCLKSSHGIWQGSFPLSFLCLLQCKIYHSFSSACCEF